MRPRVPLPLGRSLEDYARSKGVFVELVECPSWHRLCFVYGRGSEFFSLDVQIPGDKSLYADGEAVLDALYDEAVRRLEACLARDHFVEF